MTTRSKTLWAVGLVVPLVLVASLWTLMQQRPHVVATLPLPIYGLALSHDGSMVVVQQ